MAEKQEVKKVEQTAEEKMYTEAEVQQIISRANQIINNLEKNLKEMAEDKKVYKMLIDKLTSTETKENN